MDRSEFTWDRNPNFFLAGDRIIPANVVDLEPENEKGWCAEMPLGETGVILSLYAGDPTEKPWITLISPTHEEKYGHYLWVRPHEGSIFISDWGDTEYESMMNMIFESFHPRVSIEEFLDWRAKLIQMPIVVDPDLRYWRPKSA